VIYLLNCDILKILQILYSLGPGGAERLVVDISNELAHQGHDVTLCALRDDNIGNNGFYKREISEKINYINLLIPEGLRFNNILKLYKLIKKLDPQVVHCHLNLVNYLFPLTFIFPEIKFFHTIHSNPSNEVSNSIEYRLRRYFFTNHKMKAITISEETSQSFSSYYKTLPFGEIYNGRALPNPTAAFSETKKEIQYFREKGYTIFLHIGSCYPVKNQRMLVSVFNKLIQEGERVVLLIIGTGFDTELGISLKSLAGDNIIFLGEKHNVSDYLLNADVFCLTSVREGMPISLIEAFACGCIPICTPVGGLLNMIENGKTGYLSQTVSEKDYYFSIRSYLKNKEQIKKMDLIQYYHARFSIEECVNKYLSFYKK
jgi:glycosyltransferase involved in cell wall biosynthesis